MDYARFLRLRRPLWDDFAARLAASRQPGGPGGRGGRALGYDGLEELALRYRQVLHDHALAASRFPGTAAARRLQALAVEGTRRLTGERSTGGFATFFRRTFPAAFQRQLAPLGAVTALFLLAVLWGLALGVLRPGLGLVILGPEAIQGLEEGKLWTSSLVTTLPPSVSSSRIATNNLTVALSAWGGGVVAGIVPLYITLFNGLLLGAALGVTMHYSLAGELLRFIAAHGILELTLILVAAAAGLNLGRALVAAGDRPRAEALRDAGRDALAVLLGSLPWFVVLALVETFVSPAPALPFAVKLVLGLALEGAYLALALHPVPDVPSEAGR